MDRATLRRFLLALAAFAVVLAGGTVGFELMLGEGVSSSFYRAVVSTTLTGLDTKPEGADAELFTILLLLLGVAIFLYLAGTIAETIARGTLGDALGQHRRRKAISQLEDHVIICGYGRVGRRVAEEFRTTGTPYVVIDVSPESAARAEADGGLVVLGDGTDDAHLAQAGVERCRGLVASVDSDVKNLYIVLSARTARPDLFIIARASDDSSARKIVSAGADRVVQPYSSAGLHMANMVLKPQVADFLDIVSTAGGPMPDLRVEEILVGASSGPCGRSLGEIAVPETTGAVVVAVRHGDGSFDITPDQSTVLAPDDVIIGVGTAEEIRRLEDLFAPEHARD